MYNFSRYEATHNKAIDLCANLIGCARQNMMPIKALHLKPIYYEWVKGGVQEMLGRPLVEGELMQFDSVNIEKGSKLQSKPVIIEYYQNEQIRD